jgi:hypothetical protein
VAITASRLKCWTIQTNDAHHWSEIKIDTNGGSDTKDSLIEALANRLTSLRVVGIDEINARAIYQTSTPNEISIAVAIDGFDDTGKSNLLIIYDSLASSERIAVQDMNSEVWLNFQGNTRAVRNE